jgi:hypothetical protein
VAEWIKYHLGWISPPSRNYPSTSKGVYMEVHLDIDLSSMSLACARTEYALLKQKLAMKRMAFEFEMARIKARDAAEIKSLFYS